MAYTGNDTQEYLDRNPGLYRQLVRVTRDMKKVNGVKKGTNALPFKAVLRQYRNIGGSFSNAHSFGVSRLIMNERGLEDIFTA